MKEAEIAREKRDREERRDREEKEKREREREKEKKGKEKEEQEKKEKKLKRKERDDIDRDRDRDIRVNRRRISDTAAEDEEAEGYKRKVYQTVVTPSPVVVGQHLLLMNERLLAIEEEHKKKSF